MFLGACSVFPLVVNCRHLRQGGSVALHATSTPGDLDLLEDDNLSVAPTGGPNHTDAGDVESVLQRNESTEAANTESPYIESDIDRNFLTDANNTLEELSFGRTDSTPKPSQLSKPRNSTYIEAKEESLRKDEDFFDNVYPVDAHNDLFNFTLQRGQGATDIGRNASRGASGGVPGARNQTTGRSHEEGAQVADNATGNSTGEGEGEAMDQSAEV
jgi:hypothetical protein